jgi:hypothetical protein
MGGRGDKPVERLPGLGPIDVAKTAPLLVLSSNPFVYTCFTQDLQGFTALSVEQASNKNCLPPLLSVTVDRKNSLVARS